MGFDDPIDKKQGATKLSEIHVDRAQPIIETEVGETGLKTFEQLRLITADSLRRINYINYSDGRIRWDGAQVFFDSDARDNIIHFAILQTEEFTPTTARTIRLNLQGSQVANDTDKFKNIPLGNNELLYLELDRTTILNTSGAPGNVAIENAVNGGSLQTGFTLKKTDLATGMPSLRSPISGGSTQTFNIPLCFRFDWTDGVTNFQDLWWIPHGIRWPKDTTSVLGGVTVKGLEAYPNIFVRTKVELEQAIIDLGSSGGIIAAVDQITLDSTITVPDSTTILGRSDRDSGSNGSTFIMQPGGQLILGDRSKLKDCLITGTPFFGASVDEAMVTMPNEQSEIRDCQFKLQNPPPTNETQELALDNTPNNGTITLDHNGNLSAPINFNDSQATIETKIEAITGITDVTVTNDLLTDPITIEFVGPDGNTNVTEFIVNANSLVFGFIPAANEIQRLAFSGTPNNGTWAIDFDGQVTSGLDFSSNAAAVESALEALSNLTDVTVTGSFAGDFVVEFVGVDGAINQAQIIEDSNSLVSGFAAAIDEVQRLNFDIVPDSGTFILDFNGNLSAAIAFSDNAAAVEAAIEGITGITSVTVTGSFATDFVITFDGVDGGNNHNQFTINSNSLLLVATPVVITPSTDTDGAAEVPGSAVTLTPTTDQQGQTLIPGTAITPTITTLTQGAPGVNQASGVEVSGDGNRLWNNKFKEFDSQSNRTSIHYTGGQDNVDIDSRYS